MNSFQDLQRLAQVMHDPTITAKQLGQFGETYAALWLRTQQWRIIARNWSNRFGELDIIALSPTGMLSFIEVKTRRSTLYGTPQEAITARKQSQIQKTARWWLYIHGSDYPHTGIRFDVIAIRVCMELAQPQVDCIEHVFSE